jgi:hypothetical protein
VYFSYLGTGTVYANGGGLTMVNPSDSELKSNILPLSNALSLVTQINPVEYYWKDTEKHGTAKQFGVLAQELNDVLPDLVKKDGDYLGYDPVSLIPFLVGSIKELTNRIEILENKISELR